MKKVIVVFGTRPEAIKMLPLVKELKKHKEFETLVAVTGQHKEMLDQVMEVFDEKYDVNLEIMKEDQTLEDITVNALRGFSKIIKEYKPDIILVHGDTTTAFSCALAGFYNKVKVGHVEAGLRTYNKYFPYPEEINRVLVSNLCDIHFAPTQLNYENLIRENINKEDIYITGNTVIDALKMNIDSDYEFSNNKLKELDFSKKIILLTAHRRENLGEPLEEISKAILYIADNYDVNIIYPVHLNPKVRETVYKYLNRDNIILTEPLNYKDLCNIMNKSYMVITDSGGFQEEAPALKKPVIVLRNETERPEAVEKNKVVLTGTNQLNIIKCFEKIFNDKKIYQSMIKEPNPYGEGNSSELIVKKLKEYFNI